MIEDVIWTPTADARAVADVAERLESAAAAVGLTVERNRPLGPLTTFGIGGPVAVFVEPSDLPALRRVMEVLDGTTEADVPLLVVGRGSNLLVADGGFPGVALRLGKGFSWTEIDGTAVRTGGGTAMPQLAARTAAAGLAGLEFAAAIPASVGGSVRMNAGAHGGDIAAVIRSAQLVAPGGEPIDLSAGELGLSYRHSELPSRSVVVAATFQLTPEDPAVVRARLDEHRAQRRRTQPLRARSCGSTFTNPPGDSAGRLIEAAGLKGRSVGGATVSERHANFVVVEPATRAADVLALVDLVRTEVAARGGPLLEPEVRAVGDFNVPAGTT